MDQKTLMNLEMFYPPFPKKVQFGQHTYVEPNFEVVFPVFRCCPDHSIQQTNSQSFAEESANNQNQEDANNFLLDEHQNDSPWFGEPVNNNEFDIYLLDDHQNDEQILDDVIQPETTNKNDHAEVDIFVLEEEPPQTSKTVKKEDEMENHNQDHGEMDDFVLDEPVVKNQQNWLTFLRRNLVFDVIQKSLGNFKKAIDNLRAIHPRGAGIVFCMSRKECEEVAATIGDDARPFHMDIADRTRAEFLRKWMDNEVLFLCATNALDKLNIHKQNVRFVLHHTLPQSLQVYEKQCAYAGHDDLLAHCVLFYNFNDHLRVARLMREDVPKPPANVLQQKEKALWDVLRYGENVAECRRKFLASYFGQNFNSDHCIMHLGVCTICELNAQGNIPMQLVDFTHQALAVMWSMNGLKNAGVAYVADLFRGHITKKSVKKGIDETDHGRLPLLGMGRELLAADALRFIQMLVIEEYLKLKMVTTRHGTVIGYVEIGKKGREFMRKYNQPENVPPNERICLHISPRKEKRRSSSAKGNNSANAGAGTSHIDDDFYYDDEEEEDWGMPPTSRMRLE